MPKDGGLSTTHPKDGVHPGYTGGCPGEMDMAAYLDGRLSAAELGLLEEHLSSCRRCEKAVAELRDILASPDLGGDHPESVRESADRAKKLVGG